MTPTRCTATSKRTGRQCESWAMHGSTVCHKHGGNARQVRAAAQRRLDAAAAANILADGLAAAYGDNVPDIDPAEAMLSAVSWKYAEVVALRAQVAALEDKERVWGTTRVKEGGDDRGTTQEATANIWWVMLRSAEEQLVKFAAAARAAKCDERRVRLAEEHGTMVAGVIKAILDRLDLTDAQRVLVGEVVPQELRALGGSA